MDPFRFIFITKGHRTRRTANQGRGKSQGGNGPVLVNHLRGRVRRGDGRGRSDSVGGRGNEEGRCKGVEGWGDREVHGGGGGGGVQDECCGGGSTFTGTFTHPSMAGSLSAFSPTCSDMPRVASRGQLP